MKFLCALIKVSKSGYYKWLKRKGTLNRYELDRKLLCKHILEYYPNHKSWGYRQLAFNIRKDTGWLFSDNLCHKCCKMLKIKSIARKSPYKRSGDEHIVYKNIINSNWETIRPLEKVCTDTTMFYNNGKAYDLTMYIDVFNNEIVFPYFFIRFS